MGLKICANLSFMFQETASLLERYACAKRCGFTAVECAFPYDYSIEEVVEAKENAAVEQILINVYPGDMAKGELGFAAIPGKEKEFRDSIDKAIRYAKMLRCSKIHIMSGIVKDTNQKTDEVFENNIRYAIELFEKENLTGLLEPINPYSVPNYYMNSYEKAVSTIEKIDSPSLKLMLDIFHLQHLKGNLTINIRNLLTYTGHIQVAQVPDRQEPSSHGEINYDYVFKLLKNMMYNGWIGCEYKPSNKTEDSLEWRKMIE